MNNEKSIGMDVHQASISITVSDAAGKVLMECIIETKAAKNESSPGKRTAPGSFSRAIDGVWCERAPLH